MTTNEGESLLHRYRLLFEEAPDPYLVTDADGVIREANAAARDLLGGESALIDAKLVNYVVAEHQPQFEAWLERIHQGAPDARWDTVLEVGTGDGMPVEISLADDLDEIGYRWVLRDQRERVAAETQLRRVAESEHLAASELRTDARAKTSFIVSLSHDLRGLIGALVHQSEVLNLPDLSDELRQRSKAALEQNATLLAQLLDDLVEIERFALGELDLDGPVQGWVGMITDIDHRRRAEEKVRVLASTLTMAEHEERRRIAQVLHDDLQQRLYSVQMRVGLLREQADATTVEETVRMLREIEESVTSSVDLTHRLTVEISPPILEHEGLTESLEWLGSHMKELHDLRVDVHASDSFVIADEDMRVFLFQIVRELLFNVVKHADVDEARIDLTQVGRDLTIAVTDHGSGFDPQSVGDGVGPAGGMGLSNARERLALFGGAMDVYSRANDATVVRITIPLPAGNR